MFDALKRGLQKFKTDVQEEVETEFEVIEAKAPPTAAGKPAAAPPPKPAEPAKPPAAAPRAAKPVDATARTPAPTTPRPAAPATPPPAVPPARPATATPPRPAPGRPDAARPSAPPSRPAAPPAAPGASVAPAPPEATASAPKGRGIDPERVRDLLFDLEVSLLESDVALKTAEAILKDLAGSLSRIRVERADEIPGAIERALRHAILKVLDVGTVDFDTWLLEQAKPVVVMFVGVNGTGKTTVIGRIAHRLKDNGITCVMAAGDTFRAGAIEQLGQHGDNLGLTVIKTQAGGDPAAVAYDAVEHAKARKKDVVLLDTAGRMQTNTNLMDEMKKIKRVAKPAMIVFVGDSLAGNDAVEQAVQFDKAVGIDAVVLTKVDTDAKGGAALSIAHAVGKPVLFLGVGQAYADLIPYDPKWMVARIFD
ncbi:MAG TPA: signal recognition particle-docking protein FtsY [Candidatus Thermoplasmatota archaeon]|nr:signal recognition particle-docking protein FtsY [Candidatus Thermoplasmatota archaeon]